MPMRMYKALYSNTKITDLNTSIDRKIILHTYNTSCIPQMGVCKITIINKGIEYQSMPLLIMVILHTPICGMHEVLYVCSIIFLSIDVFRSVVSL